MAKMTINMISYTLRRTVDITVVLPTATIPESMGMSGTKDSLKYQGKPKFPVLYLFHGMGNNHAQWTGYTNVELFAEERNIAVVMISAENKSYVDFNGEDFYSFIEVELQDFIKGTFPISDRPEDTYIAGLSMGGYGTLVHALRNPEKYAAAGAFSAAVELNPKSLLGPLVADDGNVDVSKLNAGVDPSIDPNSLADKLIAEGKSFPKMYIACGEDDFLFETNKKFKDKLAAAGVDVTWDSLPGYGHVWRFWNIEVEKFLDFIPRTDAYAGIKRMI